MKISGKCNNTRGKKLIETSKQKAKKKSEGCWKVDLDPVRKILTDFLKELRILKKIVYGLDEIEQSVSSDSESSKSEFPSDQSLNGNFIFTKEDEAYIWLRFEVWHPRTLMHKPTYNPQPGYYSQPALPIYQDWLAEERNIIGRGKIIPPPAADCSLINYLFQLEACIKEKCEKRVVWINSLKSFVQYLREDLSDENMHGILESIFPYGMEIRDDYRLIKTEHGIQRVECRTILRPVRPVEYPIDIELTASIIKNLFKSLLGKRPNAHKNIAEALGLAWICIAVASARVMTEEKSLFNLEKSALIAPSPENQTKWFEPSYFLRIPTKNGSVNVPISKWLHDYLLALPRSSKQQRLFSRYRGPLDLALRNKGVAPSLKEHKTNPGKISFFTLMSQSHHAIGHRYIPPKKN